MLRRRASRWLNTRAMRTQATVVALAILVWVIFGPYAGLSVLGGASMVWVTHLYISSRARVVERSIAAALWRVMVGELIKVICTIALFMVAARIPHVVWPALLFGFVAALIATWVVAATGTDAAAATPALPGAHNQMEP
ncbi:MAG: ATP synthase subunit I [Proteobacteria bacterium]|nr:ATP synthase subunit I [Pseudomonadota bacterium]